MADDPGPLFVAALAAKDFRRVEEILDPAVDFRGMTPSRFWEAGDARTVTGEILSQWFEPSDEIVEVVDIETGEVAGRQRVSYRFRVRNPDGEHLVEQQAYYDGVDGRIAWIRVLCSGFRAVG